MTKEEAIKWLEEIIQDTDTYWESCSEALQKELDEQKDVFDLALSALRPITREQVERVWRGEWIDIDGEKVPVDKYGQPFGWAMCSACGEYLTASDEYPCIGHLCPNCGAPMTDEAVDMVMERMEALYEET